MTAAMILSHLPPLNHMQPLLLIGATLSASFLEVIFPPIPGIMVLIAAGAAGRAIGIHPIWLIITAAISSFAASRLVYCLGFRLQMQTLAIPKYARLLKTHTFLRIEDWFQKYGYWVLLISRFLPFARPGFALAAGILRLDKRRALIALALSILLSSAVFICTGYLLGSYWKRFYYIWSFKIQIISLHAICGLLIAAVGYWVYRRTRR